MLQPGYIQHTPIDEHKDSEPEMTILQTPRLQLHNKQLAVVTTNMRRMQMTDLLPERDGIWRDESE